VIKLSPFGKYFISGGIGWAALYAFAIFGYEAMESYVGPGVAPYILVASVGVSAVIVGWFNDRYPERITVPAGACGWVVVFALAYLHYSRQW